MAAIPIGRPGTTSSATRKRSSLATVNYDRAAVPPPFPFGFGFSYTTFAISNPCINGYLTGVERKVRVQANVTNTGSVAGKSVVQFYTGAPASFPVTRPIKELAAFGKVLVQPGQKETVSFELDKYAVSYYASE